MESLFVVFWVILAANVETKQSYVKDPMYTEESQCEKAKARIKGYDEYCTKVMLPLSKFRQIKDVGVAK